VQEAALKSHSHQSNQSLMEDVGCMCTCWCWHDDVLDLTTSFQLQAAARPCDMRQEFQTLYISEKLLKDVYIYKDVEGC